jgi:hypothetical protein
MAKGKTIRAPRVVWSLGDREQSTHSGVTITVRPLYYKGRRIGEINPDYADVMFAALASKR